MESNIFWVEKHFFEKKQTQVKFDLSKKFEMNNFLAILKSRAFYIEYKRVKFMGN